MYGVILRYVWDNSVFDENAYLDRKIFPLERLAELSVEIHNALGAYQRQVAEYNDGWTPDWSNANQHKFYLTKSYRADNIQTRRAEVCSGMEKEMYFSFNIRDNEEQLEHLTELFKDLMDLRDIYDNIEKDWRYNS